MTIIGMDIGEKRIGLAISDRDEKLSVPYIIIENDLRFRSRLKEIIDEYGVSEIVIGMPYTLKGDIGKQGQKVIKFVKDNINKKDLSINFLDERFTSSIPEENIRNKGINKKELDKFSAAIILQDYLDRKKDVNKVKGTFCE